MEKDVYVVVGQYKLQSGKYSSQLKQLVDQLRERGEVNVFDLPCASDKDSVEKDQSLFVHHYTCTDDHPAEQRIKEMVRDIVVLNPKVCYIDYAVSENYIHIVEFIYSAIKEYGIKIRMPFI